MLSPATTATITTATVTVTQPAPQDGHILHVSIPKPPQAAPMALPAMAPHGSLLLLALLLLACAVPPCPGQHWSHGWAEFRAEVLQKKREALLTQEDSARLLQEHQRLMAWNEEENARQRARREERLRKEEEEQRRQKLKAAETQARKREAFLKEREKEVLRLQEEAKTFITLENLDARIEECLDNPRNYNFAIDKEGRIVKRTMLS
ncbi:28S ribosomal protein S26, mitochondrial-like protein [Amazona aestiva]|uniref:Small ribosomal subunit protein mS26 n=1 Tax=Amazona aestiva TaxID=12930 RepID=A0A0Q3PBM2_AMAAE|nr:28S ribosomal protein S26, mitochondrial-like protein [Amazona aestiva]